MITQEDIDGMRDEVAETTGGNKIPLGSVGTYSGRIINPKNFYASDIDIKDIAISLSRQRRYAGHTIVPYTVGQHSILCGMMCQVLGLSDNVSYASFCHDVEEYLMQDVIYPIKRTYMISDFKEISDKISNTVMKYFGITWDDETKKLVSIIDHVAYILESEVLLPEQRTVDIEKEDFVFKNTYDMLRSEGFHIPEDLVNMSDDEVANSIYDVLSVLKIEKNMEGGIDISNTDNKIKLLKEKIENIA